jgi:ComF family protein
MLSWLPDFFNFLFPEVCAACGNGLFKGEEIICTRCHYQMPKTGFHHMSGNVVEKQFWGKVPIYSATSLFYFNKGSSVQNFIHRLKYHGEKKAGVFAGRMLGRELRNCDRFNTADLVVPVPLHLHRLRDRGFNQSECFGSGVAESMGIEMNPGFLVRNIATKTQTRKSRLARYENVDRVFSVHLNKNHIPKHVLLVDDVITTGSTLTSCAETILELPHTKVSVATIAYATL